MLTKPEREGLLKETRVSIRPGPLARTLFRITGILLVVALVYGTFRLAIPWFSGGELVSDDLTYNVIARSIVDTAVERGTIESQNTVRGRCELPGYENKIIWIVDEGATVQTGDVVVKFDSDEIDRQAAEKQSRLIEVEGKREQAKQELEVQKNKNESDIAAADLELALAELDLKKYRDGDYIAEKVELERSISEGDAELRKVTEEMTNMRALVRKGFRSPEQLRELELRVSSFESRVDRDKQKYRVLTDYDHQRKITEFEAKAKEARRKVSRAQTTADAELKKANSAILVADLDVTLAKNELAILEGFKASCEIKAPQAGTVAYANRDWFEPEDRIREGASVRRQQDVFYLPDMSKMQVKVNVHESAVNKIKPGLSASIRVDAFPDAPIFGTVSFVAELATSSFNNTKNYDVMVLIDKMPDNVPIKPGMTAQVDISISVYENVLAVPVGAVSEHFQQSYVYVKNPGGIKRIRVETGRTTHSFVEITEGVSAGDIVMLDAYQRGLGDFGSLERTATMKGAGDGAITPPSNESASLPALPETSETRK